MSGMDATALGLSLDVSHLPTGCTPLEALVSVKMLDEDGNVVLYDCATLGLNSWEAVGMAIAVADRLRDALREAGEG